MLASYEKLYSQAVPKPQVQRNLKGYYAFNPELRLRAHGGAEWVPWKQWLNQPLVYAGCGIVVRDK